MEELIDIKLKKETFEQELEKTKVAILQNMKSLYNDI